MDIEDLSASLWDNEPTMAKKSYSRQLGQPQQVLTSAPITEKQLGSFLYDKTEGLTIEVKLLQTGYGYLFHVRRSRTGFDIFSYTGDKLWTFPSLEKLTNFVNHVSGLRFDEDCWRLSDDLNKRKSEGLGTLLEGEE